ncbi:MAG: 2Fe-2S iron-sulfur cluster binding domain-containing protein, partial [Chloroflexia bacterium]|nr:2Fe-2S iron-sulfur cluster binding domain-containing protein [Chloroflexia bacterium]
MITRCLPLVSPRSGPILPVGAAVLSLKHPLRRCAQRLSQPRAGYTSPLMTDACSPSPSASLPSLPTASIPSTSQATVALIPLPSMPFPRQRWKMSRLGKKFPDDLTQRRKGFCDIPGSEGVRPLEACERVPPALPGCASEEKSMDPEITYALIVNGRPCKVAVTPRTTLMQVLREHLHLTGTKDGCSTGHCGSCMVLKDGEPVRSCLVPMQRADGATITTIEGVRQPDGSLHPVQQAYLDQGATQCGFCTPGFIMSSIALLEKKPDPTLEEIYAAHRWNVCRCTGYNAIIRAVQQVAGHPLPPPPPVKAPLQVVSQYVPRPDGEAKVDGTGRYAADLFVEGMLHAKTLRSSEAHARIVQIDPSTARNLPGVVAVLTADDIPGRKDCGVHEIDWPVLCYDKVRYVGDALALVIAESEAVAETALGLIDVTYEPLPLVTGPKEA